MKSNNFILGVTGGVGCGKSQVVNYLKEKYGACILILDDIAKELWLPGGPCYEEVKALFGNGILKPDGTMDRGKIAEKIFADNHLMDEMNSVVHPAVRRNVLERIENEPCGSLIVIESAILIESGYKDECDEIWYVFASRKTRTDRLIKTRGYSIDKIRSIMECQYGEAVFRENCDFVLNNDGSFEETEKIIDERVSNEILQYCQRKQR